MKSRIVVLNKGIEKGKLAEGLCCVSAYVFLWWA